MSKDRVHSSILRSTWSVGPYPVWYKSRVTSQVFVRKSHARHWQIKSWKDCRFSYPAIAPPQASFQPSSASANANTLVSSLVLDCSSLLPQLRHALVIALPIQPIPHPFPDLRRRINTAAGLDVLEITYDAADSPHTNKNKSTRLPRCPL